MTHNNKRETYAKAIFRAFSQLLNALFFGRSDITFSSRLHIAKNKGERWAILPHYFVNRILFYWQKDHCRASWQNEIFAIESALSLLKSSLKEDDICHEE